MTGWKRIALIALALPALAACGSVRDSLGLGHAQADEFASVDRPPLSIPPDFNLRPPHAAPATAAAGPANGQGAPSTAPVAPVPNAPVQPASGTTAVSPQLMSQLNNGAAAPRPAANAPTIEKDDGGWFGL